MDAEIITYGRHKKYNKKFQEETKKQLTEYFSLTSDQDRVAYLKKLWSGVNSIMNFNRPPLTRFHFFQIMFTPGVVDTNKPRELKRLCAFIESHKEARNALLSTDVLGGKQTSNVKDIGDIPKEHIAAFEDGESSAPTNATNLDGLLRRCPTLLADGMENNLDFFVRFLSDQLGPDDPQLQQLLMQKRKQLGDKKTFGFALLQELQASISEYRTMCETTGVKLTKRKRTYQSLVEKTLRLISIPCLRNIMATSDAFTPDNLGVLLNYMDQKQKFEHSRELEKALCVDFRIVAKLLRAGDGAFRKNELTTEKGKISTYSFVAHTSEIETRYRLKKSNAGQLANWFRTTKNLDAFSAFVIANSEKYWNNVLGGLERFRLWFVRLLVRVFTYLALKSAAEHYTKKLHSYADKYHLTHPIFGLKMEHLNKHLITTKGKEETFQEFLFDSLPRIKALDEKCKGNSLKEEAIADVYRLLFRLATPEQVYALFSDELSEEQKLPDTAVNVLAADEKLSDKYLQQLRRDKTLPTFFKDQLLGKLSTTQHAFNMSSSNDALAQKTMNSLQSDITGQRQILDIVSDESLSERRRKKIFDLFDHIDACLTAAIKNAGVEKYDAHDLYRMYRLDPRPLKQFMNDPDADIANKLLSEPGVFMHVVCNTSDVINIKGKVTDAHLKSFMRGEVSAQYQENFERLAEFMAESGDDPWLLWRLITLNGFKYDSAPNENFNRVWTDEKYGHAVQATLRATFENNDDEIAALLKRDSLFLNQVVMDVCTDRSDPNNPKIVLPDLVEKLEKSDDELIKTFVSRLKKQATSEAQQWKDRKTTEGAEGDLTRGTGLPKELPKPDFSNKPKQKRYLSEEQQLITRRRDVFTPGTDEKSVDTSFEFT